MQAFSAGPGKHSLYLEGGEAGTRVKGGGNVGPGGKVLFRVPHGTGQVTL